MWKRSKVTCNVSIPRSAMALAMAGLVLAGVCREGAGATFKRDVTASELIPDLLEGIAARETSLNPPEKFVMWFRNETALNIIWQPPFPPGIFTKYKVSIVPPDATESEIYVEKYSLVEEPEVGPALALFNGLIPGRGYTVSVQTVFESSTSESITGQYRTVPLRPTNVTATNLGETDLNVTWQPPFNYTEFDNYQVILVAKSGHMPAITQVLDASFSSLLVEGLQPGARYTISVKTKSRKVTSRPATTEATLQPLPVEELKWDGENVQWKPAPHSIQDEYRVTWKITAPVLGEGKSSLTTTGISAQVKPLLPGRNYNVSVEAISRGIASVPVSFAVVIPPLQDHSVVRI